MVNIDRTNKEKVIRIGNWKIKYGTVCVLGLLIILTFSSLAYLESYLNVRANAPKDAGEAQIQVGLIITFDENTSITKITAINKGANALFAFKELGNITTQDTVKGKSAFAITAGNQSLANDETHSWFLYINGGINFRGLDQYTVNEGDNLELKYGPNFE